MAMTPAQYQAEVKRKATLGKPLLDQSNKLGNQMYERYKAQNDAEVQRKATAGTPLTDTTNQHNVNMYKALQAKMNQQNPAATDGTTGMNTATAQVNTQPNGGTLTTDQIKSMMSGYLTKNPTPFSYDPNTDPQYQAALKAAQANATQANNANMAEMNRRGILNSTITSDRGAEIQQNAMADVANNTLPQMMQQAYNRYINDQSQEHQKYNDLYNLMDYNDTTARNNKLDNWSAVKDVWDATGKLVTPHTDWAGNLREANKQNIPYTQQGQANQIANELSKINLQNAPLEAQLQIKTIQQQLASGQISLEQAQFELDNMKKYLPQQNQLEIDQAKANIANTQASTNNIYADNARQAANQSAGSGGSNKPTSYKQSEDYQNDFAYVIQNPVSAKRDMEANASDLIALYGVDGYKALVAEADKRIKAINPANKAKAKQEE